MDFGADRIAFAVAVIFAVLEFAPVVFASLGLFFLSRLVDRLDPGSGRMAKVAWALVTLGTLSHATWRLAFAVFRVDISPLSTALLVFAAPGLVLLSAGMVRSWAAVCGRKIRQDPWLAPIGFGWLGLLGAFYLHDSMAGDTWRWPLLALAVMGSATMSLAAAALGWRLRLHMAAALFAFNVAVALALLGVAMIPSHPLLLQYPLEALHAGSEAAFAFAAWRVAVEYPAPAPA